MGKVRPHSIQVFSHLRLFHVTGPVILLNGLAKELGWPGLLVFAAQKAKCGRRPVNEYFDCLHTRKKTTGDTNFPKLARHVDCGSGSQKSTSTIVIELQKRANKRVEIVRQKEGIDGKISPRSPIAKV
ncbi:MAG: hypothetical protein WBE80_17250 [Methylocella sp.]